MILDAEISQLHYDVGRYVRIVGEDGVVGAQQITEKLKDVRFDVNVTKGSSLPFDEEKKKADFLQAYQLLQDPNPNPLLPDVLRQLGILNWRKVLQKHSGWIRSAKLQKLIAAVQAGQVAPEEAVQMILKELSGMAAQGEDVSGQEATKTIKEQ